MKRILMLGMIGLSFLHVLDIGRAAEMFVEPVGASGGHTIVGREITLAGGGQRVFFDIFVRGFAPQELKAYQVVINTAVMSDTGSIIGAAIQSCPSANSTGHAVCAEAFDDFGVGSPRCYMAFPSGNLQCEAGWMNKVRTDWVFYGHSPVSAVDISTPVFRWASTTDLSDLITDEGLTYYAGSMAIDVPANATGTFVLAMDSDQSALFNAMAFPNDEITPLTLLPATIKIAIPCSSDAQCGDSNLCTIDFCEAGSCVHDALAGCTGWRSIADCLTGPAAVVTPGCAAFDLDEDGHVDMFDVALILR